MTDLAKRPIIESLSTEILDREKRQWYKCCRQFSPKFKCGEPKMDEKNTGVPKTSQLYEKGPPGFNQLFSGAHVPPPLISG